VNELPGSPGACLYKFKLRVEQLGIRCIIASGELLSLRQNFSEEATMFREHGNTTTILFRVNASSATAKASVKSASDLGQSGSACSH
jgi:hypothetical protein